MVNSAAESLSAMSRWPTLCQGAGTVGKFLHVITPGNTLVSLVTNERRCKRCGILGFTLKDKVEGEGGEGEGRGGVAAGKSAASSLYPRSLSSSGPIFYPKRTPWHRWCKRSTASSSVFPDVRLLLTCPCSRIQRLLMLLAVANSSALFFHFSCSFAAQIHVLILILQTFLSVVIVIIFERHHVFHRFKSLPFAPAPLKRL